MNHTYLARLAEAKSLGAAAKLLAMTWASQALDVSRENHLSVFARLISDIPASQPGDCTKELQRRSFRAIVDHRKPLLSYISPESVS